MTDWRQRSFLKEIDFEPNDLVRLIDMADELKAARKYRTEAKHLNNKVIALIFEKTSTRTRAAFEVAALEQGAHVSYFDPSGSHIGRSCG